MPYHIDWENSGVYLKFHGIIKNKDLTQSAIDVAKDPRFPQLTYSIADLIAVDDFNVSVSETIKKTKSDKNLTQQLTGQKVAVVANNLLARPLLQIYEWQMEGSGWEIQLFDNIKNARAWIKGSK